MSAEATRAWTEIILTLLLAVITITASYTTLRNAWKDILLPRKPTREKRGQTPENTGQPPL